MGLEDIAISPRDAALPRFTIRRIKEILFAWDETDTHEPTRRDDEPRVRYTPAFRWARFERPIDDRASVYWGLKALGELRADSFHRIVIWKHYIEKVPDSHIATILRADVEAVRVARDEGLRWLCSYLNGEL